MRSALQKAQSQRQQLAVMECERWMNARIDALRMRSVFDQQTDTSYSHLPQKLEKRIVNFDPNERNFRGETLVICVVRYVSDRASQIRYINLLVRNGCDASATDSRQLRSPLMLACIARNEAITQLLIQLNVNLTAADRLGNTALMYAALYGHSGIVSLLVNQLTRRWSFDVFRATNIMGYTAEALARKNGRYECSLLLKRERLHMLQRMHRQLALINLSASLKGWSNYQTIYKAKQAFLNCRSKATGGKSNGGGSKTLPRLPRRNSAGYQDPARLSRSIGEDDFQNLITSNHLPPLKSRTGRTIGGSVEFPPIYPDGYSH